MKKKKLKSYFITRDNIAIAGVCVALFAVFTNMYFSSKQLKAIQISLNQSQTSLEILGIRIRCQPPFILINSTALS